MLSGHREDFYLERIRRHGPDYKNFDPPTIESVLNIVFTYDLLHRHVTKYMADYGLSKSTFNVLMLLRFGPPEGMQLHDLGELLLVSRANVTGLIGHLEERGYVTRIVDQQDRRARYAKATKKAELLLEELIPVHYNNVRRLLSGVSNVEKSELTDLLKKVRQSIEGHTAASEHNAVPERQG